MWEQSRNRLYPIILKVAQIARNRVTVELLFYILLQVYMLRTG